MNKYKSIALISLAGIILIGCDNAKSDTNKKKLADDTLNSMVSVEGGRFQMGDFGPLIGEKLPFSPQQDNKPLHWVQLTDFKMTKNKVTWGVYNEWLKLNEKEYNQYYKWASKEDTSERFRKPTGDNYPASVNWNDAAAFCKWVGTASGRNISLPTEAQWEYAARSRGQFLIYANSDNYYDNSLPDNELNFTHDFAPVGSFPPNPLGLYDMMGNGNEWVSDWYSDDYYKHSPEKNPQGPEKGDKKVIRGYLGSMFGLYNITRGKSKPDYEGPGDGFRCVEN